MPVSISPRPAPRSGWRSTWSGIRWTCQASPGSARMRCRSAWPTSPRCWPRNRAQLKGVLTTQSVLAGIGNAYSDEILHAARLSPFAIAARLTEAQVSTLYAAMRQHPVRRGAAARWDSGRRP